MAKLVYLTHSRVHPPETGGQQRTFRLAKGLAAAGYEVTILALAGRRSDYRPRPASFIDTELAEGLNEIIDLRWAQGITQAGVNMVGDGKMWTLLTPLTRLSAQSKSILAQADAIVYDYPFHFLAESDTPRFMVSFNFEAELYRQGGWLERRLLAPIAERMERRAVHTFDHLFSVAPTDTAIKLSDISFARDSTLFAIPIAAEFPKVVLYLTIAGVISATLAATAATVYALATMVSEDIIQGVQRVAFSEATRLTISRILIVVMIVIGFVFARLIDTDVLQLLLWALSLSAATSFPVLMMSLWWRRMTTQAAIAGVVSGFVISIAAILAGDFWFIPLPRELIGLVGLVPAVAAATLISMFGPSAPRHLRDTLRDIRIPGGETIFDREQRLQRLREQKPAP